jgi:Na+-driven multidrug efflux pump
MKRFRKDGNFWLCFILNLLMNLELTIPALILLGLHFWQNWHIRWFWIALALWPVVVLLRMEIIGLLIRWGNHSDPPKENKNPYSVKGINDKF